MEKSLQKFSANVLQQWLANMYDTYSSTRNVHNDKTTTTKKFSLMQQGEWFVLTYASYVLTSNSILKNV